MNIRKFSLLLLFSVSSISINAQQLMPKIEDNDITALLNNTAVVTLNDGSQLVGTVLNAYLMKGYLIDFSLKLQDESKRKFKPTEIISLKVRCVKPMMFSLVDEAGNVIRQVINTQYVFEHPFKTDQKVKSEMMQLLNPLYDKGIKIFSDPNAGTRSISIKGVPLEGVQVDSYMVVKSGEVLYVKRKGYEKDFKKLYGDCSKMEELIVPDQRFFDAIAGHALLYDQHCASEKQ